MPNDMDLQGYFFAEDEEPEPEKPRIMSRALVLPVPSFTFGDTFHGMKPETVQKQQWSTTAPAWRIATAGINLEGNCTNTQCPSYGGSRVIVKWGRRNFDFFEQDHECLCPMPTCRQYVQAVTVGFTDTQWKVTGKRKFKAGQPPEKVEGQWEKAEKNRYTTFDDKPENYAQWKDLKIEVKPLCN